MEHEISLKQAVICFAIDMALFLLACLICTVEKGGY